MKPRFLVVDHDHEFAVAVQRSLVSRGYEAEFSTDGLQCVEVMRKRMPSVLVLDPALLWGGGDGVVEWIRFEDPAARPTIFTVCKDRTYSIPEVMFWETDFLMLRPKSRNELTAYVDQLEILGSLGAQKNRSESIGRPDPLEPVASW